MPALEVITGRAVNPGAGPTALGPNSGDTFAVRSTPDSNPPYLLGMWSQQVTAGFIQVRSPRMHDATRGIRYRAIANNTRNFFPDGAATQLYSQDLLTFEVGGGAAETDSASLLIYYPDLGGADARLATWAQIQPMIAELVTIEVPVAGPVTAGDWSAGTAINAGIDLLKANEDYAILGYVTDTACNSIGIRGVDTSNFRAGGPGTSETLETRDWFASLSQACGFGTIPVINQANRGATTVHVSLNTAAGTVNVDLLAARLTSRFS